LPSSPKIEEGARADAWLAACLLAALLFFAFGYVLFDSGSGGERGASRADFMGWLALIVAGLHFILAINLPASRPQPVAEPRF